MRARLIGAVVIVAALASVGAQPAPQRPSAMAPEGITPLELGLAGYVKVLCSAVFVSGREPAEAFKNSGYFLLEDDQRVGVTYVVDREQKLVRMTKGALTRTAKFYGDQGCIIHQQNHDGIYFTPVPVKTRLPDAASQPWPMGDAPPKSPPSTGIDRARVDGALDLAFADPEGLTAAVLVLHQGQIVGERYMHGITKDTQLESWSMGKSLTATLFALLVKDGVYTIDDPAPVPEWRVPGDPRGAIRIVDLLHMSSGLRFIAGQDPDYTVDKGYPDHTLIYTGAIDAFRHSMTRPLQFPPNTEGRYRNSDPLIVGWLVKQAVTKRGEEYLTYPQRALFDRIGIRRQVLETDPYGNFRDDRVRLRHGAQLGAPRTALPAGRHVAGTADPAGGLVDVREHAGARVEAAGLRRPVLGERRRRAAGSEERVPDERRRRPAHDHHPDARPRRRAHGPLPRRPRRHEDVESCARRIDRGRSGARVRSTA